MTTKDHKRTRPPSRTVLEALAQGLQEIESHFELEGFSSGEVKADADEAPPPEAGPQGDAEDDDYDDEDSSGPRVFDREDIEVAIDLFISHLVQEGVIKKIKTGAPGVFAGIFEKFFGEDHEIVEHARTFEETIEGYFGWVGYDDMNAAYEELRQIGGMIDREMTRHDD